MVKSNKLKQKLRASDKRRRRRMESGSVQSDPIAATGSQSVTTVAPAVDVIGLVVNAILEQFNGANGAAESNVTDLIVVAALRSAQQGKLPSGDDSSKLAKAFLFIRDREDVSERAFFSAVQELLKMSAEHQDSSDQDSSDSGGQFVRYLSLLAG